MSIASETHTQDTLKARCVKRHDGPFCICMSAVEPSEKPRLRSGSTCLDLIETSRHTGGALRWGELRRDTVAIALRLEEWGDVDRAGRMESCSREWVAYRHVPTRAVVMRSNRCRDRFCLVCMALRSRAMVRRYEDILSRVSRLRMMTFTVRSGAGLAETLELLMSCWGRLMRRKAFKARVRGYLRSLEVTHTGAGWHPHLHVLYDGEYWLFEELKNEWKLITGGEGSVDIRMNGSIKEALKYVVKPAGLKGLNQTQFEELVTVMKSKRSIQTGGTLRGLITDEELDADECMGVREEYEVIGRLDLIVERYEAGDRSGDVVDTINAALGMGILERAVGRGRIQGGRG